MKMKLPLKSQAVLFYAGDPDYKIDTLSELACRSATGNYE